MSESGNEDIVLFCHNDKCCRLFVALQYVSRPTRVIYFLDLFVMNAGEKGNSTQKPKRNTNLFLGNFN